MQDIIFLDIESTNYIKEYQQQFPWILSIAGCNSNVNTFARFVTPSDPNFVIPLKASEKNNIYKDEFLEKPKNKRKDFATVWSEFMNWIATNHPSGGSNFVLCAYNGFDFDFRLLLHHLKENAIKIPKNCYLIDPKLDKDIFKTTSRKFQDRYKELFPSIKSE